MASDPASQPLLFVNKTAVSDSLSNSKDDKSSSINKHVQQWRQRNSSRLRFQGDGRSQRARSHAQRPRKARTAKSEARTDQFADGRLHRNEATSNAQTPKSLKTEVVEVDTRTEIPSANFLEGSSIDPFQTTPVHLDHQVQLILQYYIHFSHPSSDKLRKQPAPPIFGLSAHLPVVGEVVSGCLFNEMHMYALLTATAGRMEVVSKISLERQHTAHVFMDKTIKHLQGYLKSQREVLSDKQNLLDIFFLSVCEWYLQDYEAAITHLKAAGNMLDKLDKNSDFDKYVQDTLWYNDVFFAIESGTRPLFPLTWDDVLMSHARRLEISDKMSTIPHCTHMGRGFMLIESNSLFSLEMNAIICDLIPWLDVAQYAWRVRTVVWEDAQWVCRKAQALLYRLLALSPLADGDPKPFTKAPISQRQEEVVRLMLVILLSYITTQMAWRSSVMNLGRLKIVLDGIHQDWGSVTLNRMLFWILACACFITQDDPTEEEWYVQHAVRIGRKLDFHSPWQLTELMGQYIYSPRLQRRSLDILWTLISGRPEMEKNHTSAPNLADDVSDQRQTLGFNLAKEPGRMLCRGGHWEATSTLACASEFVAEDDDFAAEALGVEHPKEKSLIEQDGVGSI